MLLILTSLLLWVPALLGWALPWALVRRRGGGPGPDALAAGDAAVGLATLAALAVWLNLWLPLSGAVNGLVLAAGWLLLGVRLWRYGARWLSPRALGAGVVWLAALAWIAAQAPEIYDSALYHLQAVQWSSAAATPLGLANLHGRLGLNSVAPPLAALTQLPLWDQAPGAHPFVLGALLHAVYGVELLAHWRQAGPGRALSRIFMLTGAALLWTDPYYNFLSWPTTDWPVMVLTLLVLGFVLRALEAPAEADHLTAVTSVVALLAITFKLSALPLLVAPALLVVRARRVGLAPAVVAATSVLLLAPWLIRGVMLSGCLAYPIGATCWYTLPWAVAPHQAASEAQAVVSWARWPAMDHAVTLHTWRWVQPWAQRTLTTPEVQTALILLGIGALAWWTTRAGRAARAADRLALLYAGAPVGAGLIFWLATAPDPRFALGTIGGLGLLGFSLGLHRVLATPQRTSARTMILATLALLGTCLVLIGLAGQALDGPADWLHWPRVQTVATVTNVTHSGAAVQVPVVDDRCYATPLPCTPYFNPALVMEPAGAGRLRMFLVYPPSAALGDNE